MTQADASKWYRFDILFAEVINYSLYHLVPSSRISLIKSLMKRRKRGQSMSSICCRNFNLFHRSCITWMREIRAVDFFENLVSNSFVSFPRITEMYVRSTDEGWHWKLPILAEVLKIKPVRVVRSRELAKKRESKNDENEMNTAGISRRENYIFFLFTPLLCRALNLLARKSSKRLTPMLPLHPS